MVTTATWASLFFLRLRHIARVAGPSGAIGEGTCDREGVRDIGRNVRSDTSVRELARPVPHADGVAKYDEAPVPRGTSRRWEVLMSVDERDAQPVRERRSAFDVRHDHRVLQDLGADALRQIPLVAEGARLIRRGEYLDLHDPARADFRALGDETVRPGQRLVARSEVSAEVWRALLRACDRVLGRAPLPRSA